MVGKLGGGGKHGAEVVTWHVAGHEGLINMGMDMDMHAYGGYTWT